IFTCSESEAANQDIVSRLDKSAGTDVAQFRIRRLIEVVRFDETDSRRLVFSSEHASVGSGLNRGHDDGFPVIVWLERRAFKQAARWTVFPVIVLGDYSRGSMQLQDRIKQDLIGRYIRSGE